MDPRMALARQMRSRPRAPLAAALLAVLAVMVQALLPSAAMAAQAGDRGETIMICTAMGVQTIKVGGGSQKKGFAGLPCQDCLAAATAVVLPAPQPVVLPVAYATAYVLDAPRAELAPRSARAPPRPPGQGPPTA
jgi:hypothetical protein